MNGKKSPFNKRMIENTQLNLITLSKKIGILEIMTGSPQSPDLALIESVWDKFYWRV